MPSPVNTPRRALLVAASAVLVAGSTTAYAGITSIESTPIGCVAAAAAYDSAVAARTDAATTLGVLQAAQKQLNADLYATSARPAQLKTALDGVKPVTTSGTGFYAAKVTAAKAAVVAAGEVKANCLRSLDVVAPPAPTAGTEDAAVAEILVETAQLIDSAPEVVSAS